MIIVYLSSTCATVLALPILDSDGVIDVFLVSVLMEARVAFLDSVRTNQSINQYSDVMEVILLWSSIDLGVLPFGFLRKIIISHIAMCIL